MAELAQDGDSGATIVMLCDDDIQLLQEGASIELKLNLTALAIKAGDKIIVRSSGSVQGAGSSDD